MSLWIIYFYLRKHNVIHNNIHFAFFLISYDYHHIFLIWRSIKPMCWISNGCHLKWRSYHIGLNIKESNLQQESTLIAENAIFGKQNKTVCQFTRCRLCVFIALYQSNTSGYTIIHNTAFKFNEGHKIVNNSFSIAPLTSLIKLTTM